MGMSNRALFYDILTFKSTFHDGFLCQGTEICHESYINL